MSLMELMKHKQYSAKSSVIKNEIREVLTTREITDLVHFTRIENLESILINGIVPVNKFAALNIEAIRNDISNDNRIDRMKNCSCFSIHFPNSYLLNRFRRNQNTTNQNWVILIVDANVILSSKHNTYFCRTNAATCELGEYIFEERHSHKYYKSHFEELFKDTINIESKGRTITRGLNMPDNYTTDVQAEVLIENIIRPQYIKKVVFFDEFTKNNWLTLHRSKVLFSSGARPIYEVSQYYFGERKY